MNYYDLIDRYVSNQLTPEERHQMEQAIAKDSELAGAVNNHDIIAGAMDYLTEMEIRSEMNRIRSETHTVSSSRIRGKLLLVAIALVVLAAIILFWFSYQNRQADQTAYQLYAAHFTPHMSDQVRGNTDGAKTLTLCEQGHEALSLGLDSAESLLLQSVELQEPCQDKARWYLALLYLKRNEVVSARDHLKQLADYARSPYHQEAVNLLSEVEKL